MKILLSVLVLLAALLVPGDFLSEFPRSSDGSGGGDARLASEPALVDEPSDLRPLPLMLPHAERLVLRGRPDDGPSAAFEVRLTPPDVLHVLAASGVGARGGLVIDVLQRRGSLGTVRLASFGSADGSGRDTSGGEPGGGTFALDVRWAPPVEGDYVVRVGATPGSVGAFSIALDARPPLDFPVATDATDAVRSFFGDARDGGARDHHGIDIFAPRGTPVLAAADGVVARVGNSTRGGLHVWQRAEDGAGDRVGSLYYAHLDSVAVLAGTRVSRGDTLGTVGNTGNARTTPPHLHFGLYRRYRGPEDPLPLVGTARVELAAPVPGHALAPWLAVASPALNVRSGPGTAFDVVERLDRGALVRVLGVGERWARVRVRREGEGTAHDGFVSVRLLTRPEMTPFSIERPTPLLAEPVENAPRLTLLEAGATLLASGTFGRYRRVETAEGAEGWLLDDGALDEPSAVGRPDG